jgi:hypothetical protein
MLVVKIDGYEVVATLNTRTSDRKRNEDLKSMSLKEASQNFRLKCYQNNLNT